MRMVVVSNRLPITVKESDEGLVVNSSVGGMATGVASFLEYKQKTDPSFEYVWVGWPENVKDEARARAMIQEKYPYHPVFLSEEEMELFYEGFCNKTIWPLFHYFSAMTVYNNEFWEVYKSVNQAYCESVKEVARAGDLIWVHDYHLLLLPHLLRREIPDAHIAFFLHIPFPTFEIFRLLPHAWQREILEGMMGADLVGFHTHEYTQYFLHCVLRILGHEHTLGEFMQENRIIRADTFPMGIEFNKFQGEAVEAMKNGDFTGKNGQKIILSIDRLDYTKGIINRVHGFELFLREHPEWRERVSLHLIAVPNRTGVEQYQKTKKQLDELIGSVNGDYGTAQWTPILYQYKSLGFHDLVRTYLQGDVALITPLRDGMNLIAKEYLACRHDRKGALILSEMAGAAKELSGALFINPNIVEEIAQAIHQALMMPEEEQMRRNESMREYLKNHDVIRWADEMLATFDSTQSKQVLLNSKYLGRKMVGKMAEGFKTSKQRLILLDYDGTLVPFSARPDQATPNRDLIHLLTELSSLKDVLVFIISGRGKDFLDYWFKDLRVGLVAEHGACLRTFNSREWKTLKTIDTSWKQKIVAIFRQYQARVPGSFYEEKEYSLAWHYRVAEGDQDLVQARAQELFDDLVLFTSHIDVQISQGNKVIEVRNNGINKGNAALSIMSLPIHDFILAIGNDYTDEDMFKVLPDSAYSVKVGFGRTLAKYLVSSQREVISLLESFLA